jgi:hypothetical protein
MKGLWLFVLIAGIPIPIKTLFPVLNLISDPLYLYYSFALMAGRASFHFPAKLINSALNFRVSSRNKL